MQRILVASGNAKKLHELRTLCADLPVELLAPTDVNAPLPDVIEDGNTFAANAGKKALEFAEFAAEHLGDDVWALADDSGLSVDHLGGLPGVHSARFAEMYSDGFTAEDADRVLPQFDGVDGDNNVLLLQRLHEVAEAERGGAFHCVIAVAHAGQVMIEVEGEVRGRILRKPQGEAGFGYDPLFFHEPSGVAFAELSLEQKSQVSHRGIAVGKLRQALKSLLQTPPSHR